MVEQVEEQPEVGDAGPKPAWRPSLLDWVRVGLLVGGLLCVATGLLPRAEAAANMRRIGPLLLFLGSVIVLAHLARRARVFDVIAHRVAIVGRGNYAALFVLCVLFAAATTAVLNLDTTAVLLTPVMLALAGPARIAPLPLAMTTLWLANTASLLLPVSNLTNLLAANRVGLDGTGFAARLWLPQLASIAVTMVCLWVWYWRRRRRGADRYLPPRPVRPANGRERALLYTTAAACLLFIAAIPVVGDRIGLAATAAAAVAVAAFAILDRAALRWSLIPWQLLIFVVGLFLVVPTLGRWGLSDLMHALIGTDPGAAGAFRAAAAGAGLADVANNLPAYTAGEAVVPVANRNQLLALLIGTNVGSVVTPWASLATLLCLEFCRTHGVRVPMRRFVATGCALAVTATAAAVGALLLTG
ncbi:arsenic transporter [Nocardia terpenica]|uniref:SLC13 family permease n=1 Tax=Nocardia terpenica TaxID=455432 RepID=UPI0018937516|nr:SLC13 family permease [Nocardia terpenica]MBF6059692.1 arsenic transporter [Nocardia terpenica]MBF6102767.1 arsenic transporter [Nocardia terpenica]MBF6111042.1 arsenic transporter [Nocardia terpenica]MBF6117173.1 arsenic transporter [Nocardia terpenica]MBF6150986.1 arsenic transporter [Nocardia terpenica]